MTALYLERYMNFGCRSKSCSRASRSSASRRPAATCRPATAIISSSPSACAKACAKPAASCWSFRCIRSRRPASGRPPGLDRNLAYLGLVEVLFGYPIDGVVLTIGCDKTTPACLMAAATVNHAGDRAVGRADAQRLVQRRAHRFGHHRVEGARVARRRRDRLSGLHQAGRFVGTVDRLLQHDGHGDDDEQPDRGARHVAAGLGRHSGAATATARNARTSPASRSSKWSPRTASRPTF